MGWESSCMVRFDLGPLLQGQTMIAKLKSAYYPTALKGCRGIVLTHGVRMGGRREKVCPGCISETVRCRKLILGRDIG